MLERNQTARNNFIKIAKIKLLHELPILWTDAYLYLQLEKIQKLVLTLKNLYKIG